MLSHAELKAKMLSNPAVKAEYDRLVPEMALLDEFLRARMDAESVGYNLEIHFIPKA